MTTNSSTPAWQAQQEPTGEMWHQHARHTCSILAAAWHCFLPFKHPCYLPLLKCNAKGIGSQHCPAE